ncbi:MAG: polymer-forming cytoskeletal protein [Oligoflexia bacterium]|nr:polymer-forming cytoskeletal protein [Oligoflexia bacterium]
MAFGKAEEAKTDFDSSISPFKSGASNSSQKVIAFLGQGSKVVGTLTFTGPVELDGYIEGELNAEKLTVGEAAIINARISGAEILIKGTVTGDITASKRLVLQKPAKVVGNIVASNLSIEEGVIFEGQCTMASPGAASSQGRSSAPRAGSSEKTSA